ncbi:MAG: hypothetical protein ACTSR2_00135 [Candidatus Hodarchaeales archaeon]
MTKVEQLFYTALTRYPKGIRAILNKEREDIINEFFLLILESRRKTINQRKSLINVMHRSMRNTLRTYYGIYRSRNNYKQLYVHLPE